MPYQVFGHSSGEAFRTSSWIRVAIVLSGSGIALIFAKQSARLATTASALPGVFSSLARSFMADSSAAENLESPVFLGATVRSNLMSHTSRVNLR